MKSDDKFFKRILALVDAVPFQPFDIRTSDGRAYFVDSPDYSPEAVKVMSSPTTHRKTIGPNNPRVADRLP
ncbi:MAG: hypothetical protein ABIP55_10025 [Tepidisphaeraceae bacterium]